ncbi:hypothetical protein BO83DRAFT_410256 [Aspergillus eucalypticola CBS 122712]|uniref:Uncharacterized protein n=1 Tax=Aspergillus eucalypticola (strain CBS 122712 / IBT 29274) TaxID=1448314 RepID=A0A317V292_ASPEC|nr:uncharacterized protein BO83DRAFT_410256 [Aspergillus eucalypticola CBS 122712]PWY66892.1 hypothetical protein BO83DRAFT_410256 [Aspergillus eucalypticola CBS 122712]
MEGEGGGEGKGIKEVDVGDKNTKHGEKDTGLPTSQQPTNNGDTGPLCWRRKGKLSAEKTEKPMDPAAANPVVRKPRRQKEVPFGCSILTWYYFHFAALLPDRFPLVDKSDDSMADLLAPWPSLAGSGSPPAFYDIMENRRWWPRDLPDGAGSSRGRVRTPPTIGTFLPTGTSELVGGMRDTAILVRVILMNRYSFVLKSMSPSTPDLHAPLMQYSLPNNYYTPALHLLRAGSRDPAESASPVTPASSPLLLFPSFVIHDLPLLDPEIRRTQSLTVFSSSTEKLMKAGHMSKFRPRVMTPG